MKMSGSRPAKWVKLWREERGDFSRLPLLTRAFAAELLKFVDDDGRVDIGTDTTPAQELGRIMGADTRERRALVPIINALIKVDYITIEGGLLTISHWSKWQALGDKQKPESAPKSRSVGTDNGIATVSQWSDDGSAMVSQRLPNGSRKYAESLKSVPQDIERDIDIDKEYKKDTVVELQRRDESRPVTLENIFPALDEKNIPGGETPPSLDSADAGGPGLPPVAAPPRVVCRSPVSIAGAQCHQESIIGEETSGCSASKAESIVEPHKRSRAKAQKASASPEVDAVFCYWKKITGSEKAQLSDARAKRIEWAIKTYGVEDCKACIDGYGSSDFHRGVNDRQTPYLDLTLWFRDETKFEAGLVLSKMPSAQRIRRNRVPTTRKEFLSAAREAAQFFWDTKEILGVDSEPRNQGWNEWVYRFVHAAIVTPYRRYVCGDTIGEDVLWAAFNAELDAYEVSPVEIHPGVLEKRIAASVDEWKAARIFAVDSGQEQATSEVQA